MELNLFEEIMAENFFNLIKETDIHVPALAQENPQQGELETHIQDITIENTVLKDKRETIKSSRENIYYELPWGQSS